MSNAISAVRWHLKKIARRSIAHTPRFILPRKITGVGRSSLSVRTLTYHRFGDVARDPFCVSGQRFAEQMEYLAENGLAISLADLVNFLDGNITLKPDSVLVTIDDGFRSTYSKALPILREFGIPAVAFITPAFLQPGDAPLAGIPEPYMSWQEVRRLADNDVAIGSHAWTHRSLGKISEAECRQEAIRSREALEQELDTPVTAFAYPFGTLADFNDFTANVLKESGYTHAFTSQHGAMQHEADPLALPRIKVEGGEGIDMFRRLVHGGLDGWQLIDRMLWRIQASGHD